VIGKEAAREGACVPRDSLRSLHVAFRRLEIMKISAREWGKLAVCLGSFNAVFRENQANCQFALPFSEKNIK
jgi:hypothetical protein